MKSIGVALSIALLLLAGSCQRTATKSQYISSQVTVVCADTKSDALRACRIEVIKTLSSFTLEELKQKYPEPVLADRPGCWF